MEEAAPLALSTQRLVDNPVPYITQDYPSVNTDGGLCPLCLTMYARWMRADEQRRQAANCQCRPYLTVVADRVKKVHKM